MDCYSRIHKCLCHVCARDLRDQPNLKCFMCHVPIERIIMDIF